MNLEVFTLISTLIPVVTEVVQDVKALKGLEGDARLDMIVELALDSLRAAETGLSKDLLDDAKFEEVIRKAVALIGEVQDLVAVIKA